MIIEFWEFYSLCASISNQVNLHLNDLLIQYSQNISVMAANQNESWYITLIRKQS